MADRKFLFLHVMKTGGWTLRRQIGASFEPDEVYPCKDLDDDMLTANLSLEHLVALPAARRARIRVFAGHFPWVAAELLDEELTTITILREPVERTLSLLRRHRTIHRAQRRLSLEELYDDPVVFEGLIRDHQAKLFALTVADEPETYMDALEVDAGRLELAKRNLERVDLLGTQDRFDELAEEVERRFGWRRRVVERWNQGPPERPGDAPASFRRRIAEDNRADMEFFEHARELCARRRPATVGP